MNPKKLKKALKKIEIQVQSKCKKVGRQILYQQITLQNISTTRTVTIKEWLTKIKKVNNQIKIKQQ